MIKFAIAISVFIALTGIASAIDLDTSVNLPVSELQFYKDKEGLTVANAWGDPASGAHSNFIRMEGNTRSPPHMHTASYYGVVITGVVANVAPGAQDLPLPAGSYWYQKGQEPHVTACLSQTECLIFVTSAKAFDFIVVK